MDNLITSVLLTHIFENMSSFAYVIGDIIFFFIYINVSLNGNSVDGIIAKLPSEYYYPYGHLNAVFACDYMDATRTYHCTLNNDGDISLKAARTDHSLGVTLYGFTSIKKR